MGRGAKDLKGFPWTREGRSFSLSPAILMTRRGFRRIDSVERPVGWVASGGLSVSKWFRVLWSKGGDGKLTAVWLEPDRDGVYVCTRGRRPCEVGHF